MTVKAELYDLFQQGKTPVECINLGYRKTSVYNILKNYEVDKEKERNKVLTDESERIKKVWSAFKEGLPLNDIVEKFGISPDYVVELHGKYIELSGIEGESKQTIDEINELDEHRSKLKREISEIVPIYEKMMKDVNEERAKNISIKTFEAMLKERRDYLENELILDSVIPKDSVIKFKDDVIKKMNEEISKIEGFLTKPCDFVCHGFIHKLR